MKIVLARDLVSAAQVETLKPNVVLKVGDRVAVECRAVAVRTKIISDLETDDRQTTKTNLWK